MAEKIVFVGGPPRSGTTLVQRILLSHPEITGGPEFDYIPEISRLYKKLIISFHEERINKVTSIENIKFSFENFIGNLLQELDPHSEFKYLSEKTPDNVHVFNYLHELSSKYKFIFVYRNPLDILASMNEVRQKMIIKKIKYKNTALKNVITACRNIHNSLNTGFEISGKHPERICKIKYEDIINNEQKEAEKLFRFLNIENIQQKDDILSQSKLNDKLNYDDVFYSKEKYGKGISKDRIGNGLKTLKKYELYIAVNTFRNFDSIYKEYNFSEIQKNLSWFNIIYAKGYLLLNNVREKGRHYSLRLISKCFG